MFMNCMDQDFGWGTVRMALLRDVWGFSWEDSMAGSDSMVGGWSYLELSSLTCLGG